MTPKTVFPSSITLTLGILECSNTRIPVHPGSFGTCLENRKGVNKWWSPKVIVSIHCPTTKGRNQRLGQRNGPPLPEPSTTTECARLPQRALQLLCPPYSPSDPVFSFRLLAISFRPGTVGSRAHSFSKAFSLEELSYPRVFNINLHQDCVCQVPGCCGPSEGVGPFLAKCWLLSVSLLSAVPLPFMQAGT